MESQRLKETLDRIASSNADAKQIIERVRADYRYEPFRNPVELDPGLGRALDDILRNAPEPPDES